jgi:DNA-binding protein HU-beta
VAKIPKVARVPKILPAPKPIVPVKIVRSALYKAQESGIVRETALAEYLSKTTKLSRTDVLKVLVALPEAITELVRDNDLMVRIKGFGSFKPRTRAARIGRNPATGAPINILASKSVFFSVHKNIALKDDENVEENSK